VSIDFETGVADSPIDDEETKEEGKSDEAVGSSSDKKNIKLFKIGHKIPAKRLLSFKRDEDLTFTMKYDGEMPAGTPNVIAQYNITGVPAAMARYPNASKPKISVSFRLTRSGLVDVDRAEAALEEMVEVEVCRYVKANASNTTSNATNATSATAAEPEKEAESIDKDKEAEKNENATDKKSEDSEKKTEKVEEVKVCSMKPEKRVHRVSLKIVANAPVIKPFNTTQIRAAKAVLEGYDERESKIRERASAFNALESYIYVTKEKLEGNEELISVTTKEFRETFTEQLTKMNSWLEEDGWNADTATLKDKLSELTTVGDPAFWRVREMIDRPEIVKKAREMTVQTDAALKNVSKERSWLNKSHLEV
jgi:hypoxia up-regulated 1